MSDLLRCRTTFVVALNGQRVKVRQGDIVHSDDQVVELAREHFDLLENYVKCFGHNRRRPSAPSRVVEQATAEPGEKRTTVRRPKKADEPLRGEKKEDKDA